MSLKDMIDDLFDENYELNFIEKLINIVLQIELDKNIRQEFDDLTTAFLTVH